MYTVKIKRSAEKELDALPETTRLKLAKSLLALGENPRPRGSKKLTAREDYRIRVGNYRVLYSIQDKEKVVEVIAVGDRRDVYRRR